MADDEKMPWEQNYKTSTATATSDEEGPWNDYGKKSAAKPASSEDDVEDYVNKPYHASPSAPEKPGFGQRLRESFGIPDWDTLEQQGQAEGDKPASEKLTDALKAGTGYEGLKSTATGVYDWGKRALGNIGQGLQEEKEAAQNIKEGGPILQNIGKAGAGIVHGGLGSLPFVGEPLEQAGQDIVNKNYAGAAGGITGVIGQAVGPELLHAGKFAPGSEMEAAAAEHKAAAPPKKGNIDYDANFQRAAPHLAEEARNAPVTNMREAHDAANNAIKKIDGQVKGAIAQIGDEKVNADSILDRARAAVDAVKRTPEERAAAMKLLDGLGVKGQIGIGEADALRERLNAELAGDYDKTGSDRATLRKTNSAYAANEAAANALRDAIYDKLEERGVKGARDLRRDQGALMEMRDHYRDNIVKAEAADTKEPPGTKLGKLATVGGKAIGGAAGGALGSVLGPGGAVGGAFAGKELGGLAGEALGKKLSVDNRPNARIARSFEGMGKSDLHAPVLGAPTPIPTVPAEAIPPGGLPFEKSAEQPRANAGLWEQQVGKNPDLTWGGEAPQRLGRIGGEQLPLELPPHEQPSLFTLGQTPRVGERRVVPEGVAGLLPEPRATELPPPGSAELAHPEMFPKESGTGVPERDVQRAPSGRMQRVYKGTSEPREVGRTAEGGAIHEGEQVPERLGRIGGEGREGELGNVGEKEGIKIQGGEDLGPGMGKDHIITRDGKRIGSIQIEEKGDGVTHVHWLGGEFTPADRGALMSEIREQYPETQKITYDRRRVPTGSAAVKTEAREMNVGGEKKVADFAKPQSRAGESVWEGLSADVQKAIKNESAGPLTQSHMEDLKQGDTFVDDEGEPRRITAIGEDGKIHTADGTERTYDQNVEHLGEINSPRAQLARGGKFIAPAEFEEVNPQGSAAAKDLADKLGAKVVGSAAKEGTPRDIDLRLEGDHQSADIEAKMKDLGFESRGSSLVSPEEAKKSGKQYADGWNRVEHFENEDGRKVDVWHNDTPAAFGEGDTRISTRTPTAMKATENPHTHALTIDMKAVEDAKGLPEKLRDAIKSYPGMEKVLSKADLKNPAVALKKFIDHVAGNLEWLHNQMPPEVRAVTGKWYESANRIAKDLAEEHGLDHKQTSGVMAALSPQKDWNMNVSLAKRVVDTMQHKGDTRFSPEMAKKVKELTAEGRNEALKGLVKNIKGKTLNELTDPYEKAAWIRVYDEAHNPRAYDSIAPDGRILGNEKTASGEDAKVAWGDLGSITKAVNILQDGSRENISRQLGSMHKVRNFYNNIVDPMSTEPDVTIDTHAVAAGHIQPFSGNSKEVANNFGGPSSAVTGSNGTYPLYAEAYRQAAEKLGLKPRELQSIVWEQVRDLFPAEWKTAANAKKVADIWGEYGKGKLTLDQARGKIVETAGGFKNKPEWLKSGSDRGVPEEK